MRYLFFFLCLGVAQALTAQTEPLVFASGNSAAPAAAAVSNVNASDGVYDKFVLVRWEAAERSAEYRLFRATSANGASMLELTKNWQKSTWFCDYSAEKGRDYYYAVMESDGKTTTPLSRFDKGFLRKSDNVAIDESLSATTPDKYAAGKVVFLLVSEVTPDTTTYAAGSTVPLKVGVQNIFEEAVPRTDLRVYLSSDATWDFADQVLLSKSYSGFPAGFSGLLEEKIQLPAQLLPGPYYLLVVAAPDGNILNAKTGASLIQTTQQ